MIVDYFGYKVSDDGIVYGKYGKEIGKPNSKGYAYVDINGKLMLRHRIIWMAFNGEIPEGVEVDHIIPIKNGGTDALSNLRLLTHGDNCNNEMSIQNYKKSNKVLKGNAKNKKHINQFTLDGLFVRAWHSSMDIQRELGFFQTSIIKCCRGKLKQAYGYIWEYA